MFEMFTNRARRVLELAQQEALELGHDWLGGEHLLAGMAREGEGVAYVVLTEAGVTAALVREWIVAEVGDRSDVPAAEALATIGIDLESVRQRIEETFGPDAIPSPETPPFTPRAKAALEHALQASMRLGHPYIGTEHLLLGLLDESENLACRLLADHGVELEVLATATVQKVAPDSLRVERARASIRKLLVAAREAGADSVTQAAEELRVATNNALLTELHARQEAIQRMAAELEAVYTEHRARLQELGVSVS